MAGTKAAGTADGSPQHTPKQAERDVDAFAKLSPEVVDKLLDIWKARHDEEQRAAQAYRRVRAVEEGHTTPLTDAQLAALEKLRVPFEADQISKRPHPWCKACNASPTRVCGNHKKINCVKCGTWITEAHDDLDYVGHAGITDRLLSVDPTWDWKPLSVDDRGQPYIDERGGMWILLTVCGMTRKGYGDAVGKKNGTTAVKEIIGDGIRNAAMRFGMALDLWSKTDLHKESEPEPNPAEPFLDALRQERIWWSEEWLAGVRREAEEAGQLDYKVPTGGGATLGEIIDNRLTWLADSARLYAEAKIKKEEERAAAVAQVAAEHGVPAQQSTPPPTASDAPAGPPPRQEQAPAGPPPRDEGPQTTQQVRDACAPIWLDPDALQNLLTHAQKIRAANEPADPSKPRGVTLGQAIRTQINELRRAQAQRASTGQASDAAHQYAEPHEEWRDTGDLAG
jgi:hypothetical protein